MILAQMPKFREAVASMSKKSHLHALEYNDVINMLMTLKGYTYQKAEEELLKYILKTHPFIVKYDQALVWEPYIWKAVEELIKEYKPKYDAVVAERSWQEVLTELKQSPVYKELTHFIYSNYCLDVDNNLIRKQFVDEYGRELANVKDDYQKLLKCILCYPVPYYKNTPAVQKKYNMDFINRLIAYGKSRKTHDDKMVELAAYSVTVLMWKKYPSYDFTLERNSEMAKRKFVAVLENLADELWKYRL